MGLHARQTDPHGHDVEARRRIELLVIVRSEQGAFDEGLNGVARVLDHLGGHEERERAFTRATSAGGTGESIVLEVAVRIADAHEHDG